jgi:hypothetical protein
MPDRPADAHPEALRSPRILGTVFERFSTGTWTWHQQIPQRLCLVGAVCAAGKYNGSARAIGYSRPGD